MQPYIFRSVNDVKEFLNPKTADTDELYYFKLPSLKYYCDKYPRIFEDYVRSNIGERTTSSLSDQIKKFVKQEHKQFIDDQKEKSAPKSKKFVFKF